jgi:D-alanyl-D-alanine-carboxypeptidase/D-alanyl-D-alanine-endopeptidase
VKPCGPLPEQAVAFARRNFSFAGVVLAIGRLEGECSRVDMIAAPGAPEADGDTLFEIGSLTKPITATVLASLVRTGDVQLETPLGELFPDGVRAPQKAGGPITLFDLATHRSGLPRLPLNIAWSDLISDDPYRTYNRGKLLSFLDGYRLPFAPGDEFVYSNLGYGLLGTLLADRADQSYAGLVRERVFTPLAMHATRADYGEDFRLLQGHTADGAPTPPWHFGTLQGAGAARSTVNDLLRFLAIHLPAAAAPLCAEARLTQTPCADAVEGQRIGLAWFTDSRGNVWHNGGTGGSHSFMGFSPVRRQAVVVLANAAVDAIDILGAHLLDAGLPLRV